MCALNYALKQQCKVFFFFFLRKQSVSHFLNIIHSNQLVTEILMGYFCSPAAEEVDASLMQLCSSQLKLLQLYTNIQKLQSSTLSEACSENVSVADRHEESGSTDWFCWTAVLSHSCRMTWRTLRKSFSMCYLYCNIMQSLLPSPASPLPRTCPAHRSLSKLFSLTWSVARMERWKWFVGRKPSGTSLVNIYHLHLCLL